MKALHWFISILAISLILTGCIGQIMTPYPGADCQMPNPPLQCSRLSRKPQQNRLTAKWRWQVSRREAAEAAMSYPGLPGRPVCWARTSAGWVKLPLNGCKAAGIAGKAKTVEAYLLKRCWSRMLFFPRTAAAIPARRD